MLSMLFTLADAVSLFYRLVLMILVLQHRQPWIVGTVTGPVLRRFHPGEAILPLKKHEKYEIIIIQHLSNHYITLS